MKPWELWQLTFCELNRLILAHQRREYEAYHRLAWLAATLLNPFLKDTCTPDALLGLSADTDSDHTPERFPAAWSHLWETLQAQRTDLP